MNFLKWLIDILFGWIYKGENPYVKVLKDQYLWLIVAPIVIIGGTFYYFHTNGIAIWAENELITVIPFYGIPIFIFIRGLMALGHLLDKMFPEAFGALIQSAIVLLISVGYWHYYMPDFTQRVENFQKEKRYYLRQIAIQGSEARDGKGQLLGFQGYLKNDSYSCKVVYDESDTLLNPVNDHRGLSFAGNISSGEKTGDIPIKIKKIEPKFYYVCLDYGHIQPLKK